MAESFIQDRSKNEVIEAFYTPPKGKEIFSFRDHCKESEVPFKFRYLRTVEGVKWYDPIDINFKGSSSVPETDLTISPKKDSQ